MNILLIVITLLMILTGVTYSRMEDFRNGLVQRAEYENFIKTLSRQEYNNEQVKMRGYSKCSPQQLKLGWLLQRGKNETDSNIPERRKLQLKELIEILYGRAAFYQQAQKKVSDFQDRLVEAIIRGMDQLMLESVDKKQTFRIELDLAKVPIDNADLANAFQLMLKGTKRRAGREYDSQKNSRMPSQGDNDYYSLLDFISYNGGRTNINAAPPEVLDVFFNPEDTDAIIALRVQMENANDADTKGDLKNNLSSFISKLKRPEDKDDIDIREECKDGSSSQENNPGDDANVGKKPAKANNNIDNRSNDSSR